MQKKTIFACSRCGQEQRLTDDDVAKIKERAREYYAYLNQEGKNEPDATQQERYNELMETINRIS